MAKKDNEAEEFTADNWPVDRWPNFSFDEMRCSHTGDCWLSSSFMDRLQGLRSLLKTPMLVTSGYRAPTHPVEAGKPHPGTHSEGHAVDLRCGSGDAWKISTAAANLGFTGIGISQSSQRARFVHLDDIDKTAWSRPAMWSY